LDEYCNNTAEDRILVFVETKRTADFLASLLSETKISSTSIHGDRLQSERETALRDFRSGKRKVLIATSVAARGLDIKGVTHVINYDLPKDVQDYVHRIGRTGRVGNRGKATSFYDPENDSGIASDLARILKEANQPIPEFLGEAGTSYGGDGFGGQDIRKGVAEGNQQEEDGDW
jgi:probable ATP-dependent RNA helicase DDX4